jgi:hypothetical protein
MLFLMLFLHTTLAAAAAASHGTSGPQWQWKQATLALSETASISLELALAPVSAAALDAAFLQRATPSSPQYGRYLSFDEIVALTRDDASRAEVIAWLQNECGASSINVSRGLDWISATAPKDTVETCLSTTFALYAPLDADAAAAIVRAETYTVPPRLAAKITTISSITRFPDLSKKRSAASARSLSDSPNVTTPTLLASFYSIDLSPVANGAAATQAVYEQGQSFFPSDLAAFQRLYNITGATPVTKIIGTANQPGDCDINPGPCIEGELDTQYISSIAAGADLTYYAYDSSASYPDYIKAVSNDPKCALVHSMSYGASNAFFPFPRGSSRQSGKGGPESVQTDAFRDSYRAPICRHLHSPNS